MRFLLILVLLTSSILALPSTSNILDTESAGTRQVRDLAINNAESIKPHARNLESRAISKRANNFIPTPVQNGAVYRLLGRITFTIVEVAPGVIEMLVANTWTQAVKVALTYSQAGNSGFSNAYIEPQQSQTLELSTPHDFSGTYEISANWD